MRPSRLIFTLVWSWIVLGVGSAPSPAGEPASPPPGSILRLEPTPIILDAPTDREAFWNRLARPDFVVIDGAEYRNLRVRLGLLPSPDPARAVAVGSVQVTGRVAGDWAHLEVTLGVSLDRDESTWVPVRLEGLLVSRATEAGRDLPVRQAEDHGWQVELAARGEHQVSLQGTAPVRVVGDLRRLDLPITPAAATGVDLDVGRAVRSAATGSNEPIDLDPGGGTHLVARLSPRPRLELSWREKVDPAQSLPTLLTARGEVAVEVERGLMRTRSSWTVAALRGSPDRIAFRVSPQDEITEVEVDGRITPFQLRNEANRAVVTVRLDTPLTPDQARQVRVTTRRSFVSGNSTRLFFPGLSWDEARIQTGVMTVTRSGPVAVAGSPGRGVRRVDVRPDAGATTGNLGSRSDLVGFYEFSTQPFEIHVQVDPEPMLLRAEDRTDVAIGGNSALVQSRWDVRSIQGRPFEVSVRLPRGLTLESAGPAEVVESTQVAQGPAAEGGQILTITLSRAAREAASFRLDLRGRSEFGADQSSLVVPLFRLRDVADAGGTVAVRGRRNLAFDLVAEPDGVANLFRGIGGPTPDAWPWSSGATDPAAGVPPVWFHRDPGADHLGLRVAHLPVASHHESLVTVQVDRTGASVVDEVDGVVDSGSVSSFEVVLPAQVPDPCGIDGTDVSGQDLLERLADGSRKVRVRFNRDQYGAFRLRFRYRVGLRSVPSKSNNDDGAFSIRPVQIRDGGAAAARVHVTSEPGMELAVRAPGWVAGARPIASDLWFHHDRVAEVPAPLTVSVHSVPTANLPTTIASRVWIRTIQRPDGDLETSAWFHVETRAGGLSVALPPGSVWTRASVDGDPIGSDVETLGPDRYRIRLGSDADLAQVLVRLEYVVPSAASRRGPLIPPRLLDDAVVAETAWEVQVIGTRVGVGVPAGWTDENEWYRDGIIARRRPWKTPAALAGWVAGSPASAAMLAEVAPISSFGRHGYLFSRNGPPAPLTFWIESRFVLVGLFSGPVLVIGLLILARRPPPRPWVAVALVGVFAAGVLGEFNVLVLILQSSALGLILLAVAAAMQGWLGRRGFATTPRPGPRVGDGATGGPGGETPLIPTGSLVPEGSTVIEKRGGSVPVPIQFEPTPAPPAPSTASLAQP